MPGFESESIDVQWLWLSVDFLNFRSQSRVLDGVGFWGPPRGSPLSGCRWFWPRV